MGPIVGDQGFTELKAMNLIDRIPKIAVIQVDGCGARWFTPGSKGLIPPAVASPKT
jgi:hypothetical protein